MLCCARSHALTQLNQVPAGPYNELWDWDSVFLGVATSQEFGAGRYFVGSMMNFLSAVNLSTGDVKGCLTPEGSSPTLYHAKPIIIQGAWLAVRASGGDPSLFRPFEPAMRALLAYWEAPQRVDAATGLHRWHDQLETGADNLVYSACPSAYSSCWDDTTDAFTLSSPDIETFIAREHLAFARFLAAWGVNADVAAAHLCRATEIAAAVDAYLFVWSDLTHGYYGAYNVSTQQQITNRTYQMAWPVWDGGTINATLIAASVSSLELPDMLTAFGVRSTSSSDPRYTNEDVIVPYSNWRGPVWINVNSVLAFALRAAGYEELAVAIAGAVVHTLAEDIRSSGTWHECYSSSTGAGLAAPGFLSWNTHGATLVRDIATGMDPFAL